MEDNETVGPTENNKKDRPFVDRGNIHDVARRAKVSFVSVSRVFNGHPNVSPRMREKVLAAARKVGYQPKWVSRPKLIGILVGDPRRCAEATDMNRICCRISLAAGDKDFHTRVIPLDRVELLTQHALDGVIEVELGTPDFSSHPILPRIPVVLTQHRTQHPPWSSVTVDYEHEGAMALDALCEKGHRRIAFLVDSLLPWTNQYRIRGLEQRRIERGLPEHFTPILDLSSIPLCELAPLLRHEKVSALVNFCCEKVHVLLDYLFNESRLRIPEEMSLLTLDNSAFSGHYHPRVSFIRQELDTLARGAVEELFRRMNPGTTNRNIQIRSHIEHRQTSKTLP